MKRNFKIAFMGTPEFAVASLEILHKNGFEIVAVVTAPDKPAGRGQKLTESPVKKYAVKNKLNVLQPTNLKDPKFIKELKDTGAEVNIVVAFRMLPEEVWAMPRLGSVNLHASLLPAYRGAAPINWAIIKNEKVSGVTTFFIQQEIDTGNIIYQEKLNLEKNETAGSLHDKLQKIGAEILLQTVRDLAGGVCPQNPQVVGYAQLPEAPKLFKNDCKINWTLSPDKINNFIRGLSPHPAAWSNLVSPDAEAFSVKIFQGDKVYTSHANSPGMIDTDGKTFFHVFVPGGFIELLDVQLSGKKRMEIEDFLRGFKINNTWFFEA